MPGLYGFTGNSNVSVNVGNTIGLYQQNTGNVYVVNNAVTLLNTLSQAGNVNFALTDGNSKVLAYTANIGTPAGTYGSDVYVPQITITSDGRITAVTNVQIPGVGPLGYGNANVTAFLPVYGGVINSGTIFNDSGFAIQGRDYTQMQYTNGVTPPVSEYDIGVGAWFYIDAGGGIFQSNTTGTLKTITFGHDGSLTVGGNVTAPYFIGDGSQLTNLPVGNYSNVNVTALLSSNTVSTIRTTGNITTIANIVSPAYLYPNGVSILTGIGGTYSNTNVAAYLTTATINTSGNVTAGNLISNNFLYPNGVSILSGVVGTYSNTNVAAYLTTATITTTGNITGANLTTAGNLTANYVKGNGSLLTNLPTQAGTYSNTNVSALLSSNTVSTITTTGNITTVANIVSPAYLYPNGVSILTGIGGTYSNTNVAAFLTTATIATSGNITGANLITAGNIYGNYVIGNGSLLTNLPVQAGTYSNTNVAAYLTTATIATTGNITGANLTTAGNVSGSYILGDGSKLTNLPVQAGTYSNTNVSAYLTTATITTSGNITAGNLISANFLYPNGASILTGIGGTYSNANVASYLPVYSGNIGSSTSVMNNINAGGTITLSPNIVTSFTPTVAITGSGYTATQGASGSFINLTTPTGNIFAGSTTGNVSMQDGAITATGQATVGNIASTSGYFWANGTAYSTGVANTYSNTNVSALLSSNTVTTISTTGNITTVANIVSPRYLYPNGVSILTGISGTYSNTNVAAYLPTFGGTVGGGTFGGTNGSTTLRTSGAFGTLTVTNPNGDIDITNVGIFGAKTMYLRADGSIQIQTPTLSANGNLTLTQTANVGNLITTGGVFWANGSAYSTGASSTYSNTNVAAYLTTATISTTGNITAANLITGGNVYGSYIIGDGSLLTNLPVQAGTYSNANVASYMPVFGGNILAGNIDIPYTSGTRNRGPLAIGGNLNHYDSGVVASFQGNEATYLYTSLQNTNTGNTAYSSYAVNDGSHTYYGELGINSGTYDYAAAGYPNNAFSKPYATFIQSTGANLAIGTYDNNGISFLVNGQTNTADAMTIANTGNVTVTGNLAVGSQTTVGNIKSTSGYFWANAAVYDGFSGDLVSRTLTASGTGRILANAYPQSNVTAIAGGYTQGGVVITPPSYTSGNLNSQNQTITLVTSGNVNFLTTWANATNRTSIGTMAYLSATATSANTAMNTADRIRGLVGGLDLNLNGKSWGAMSTASQSISPAAVNGQTFNLYGTGNMGHAISIGAVMAVNPVNGALNVQYASANFPAITQLATNSPTACSITYARLYGGVISGQSGNVTVVNGIGLHIQSGWVSSNVSLVNNAYAVLVEDTRSVIQTAGNIVATATSNVILGQGQMVSYRDKIQALGSTSGTLAFDGNVAPSWTATLNGNITLSNSTFTNYASGSSVTAIFTQDATGSRILTSTQIKWAGASSTLSTAANAIDIVNFYYDGTTWYGSLVKGYA